MARFGAAEPAGGEYTLAMASALSRPLAATLALMAFGLGFRAPAAQAHEIPARVMVHSFFRPEGKVLRVLVRAPLEAMRDVEFPLRFPGYIDLGRADSTLREAARLWIAGSLTVLEEGRELAGPEIAAVRISLPNDRSFESWDEAIESLRGPPLPATTELVWQQALLDVMLEYSIDSDGSEFAIRTGFNRLGRETRTVVRYQAPGGTERAFELASHDENQVVRLDPRWHHAAVRFTRLGVGHILDGLDHLLFVLCLVIPFRRLRSLVAIVTSFTVAHSVTLIAATLGLAPSGLWFPPLVETLIALSILYMAFENILGARVERRWVLAFGFGLIHGFGFSFFLRDSLQFAGAHLATALVAFNLGVELGQILVIAAAVPVLSWLFRPGRVPERAGVIILSALVAHTAWHWMTERLGTLREFPLGWPALGPGFLAGALRVAILLLIIAGAAGLLVPAIRRIRAGRTAALESPPQRGEVS